jgi:hypothetical protein
MFSEAVAVGSCGEAVYVKSHSPGGLNIRVAIVGHGKRASRTTELLDYSLNAGQHLNLGTPGSQLPSSKP